MGSTSAHLPQPRQHRLCTLIVATKYIGESTSVQYSVGQNMGQNNGTWTSVPTKCGTCGQISFADDKKRGRPVQTDRGTTFTCFHYLL